MISTWEVLPKRSNCHQFGVTVTSVPDLSLFSQNVAVFELWNVLVLAVVTWSHAVRDVVLKLGEFFLERTLA